MKARILYVDDELDNLTAFKAVFRRTYDIDTANSAAEALEMVQNVSYNVVISDQRMPKMTGVDLFEKLKTICPDSIRMVLTGYSDMDAIVDAINKGNIYYYITKPWNAENLQLIINKAIETFELRKNNQNLEKENILAQFKLLQNQINPHFLFNSMNILGSLIKIDPEKAVMFTRKFSNFYRRVLELRDEVVISLLDELEIIDDYLHLQSLRFDDALHVNVDIPDNFKERTLPPFALQIVVENAIKHNVIAGKNPLTIDIYVNEVGIEVKNNLQLRGDVNDSTGTGLSNLKSRYDLIGGTKPKFVVNGSSYVAWLPTFE